MDRKLDDSSRRLSASRNRTNIAGFFLLLLPLSSLINKIKLALQGESKATVAEYQHEQTRFSLRKTVLDSDQMDRSYYKRNYSSTSRVN